ncbi:MAG TPA: glycosyltransferase family 87 protein [Candidatus Dormibacteraeota bacterium]|nr:glycosyltransferase family 87 protein [Candidatus Dormibacteraeota bacterium]
MTGGVEGASLEELLGNRGRGLSRVVLIVSSACVLGLAVFALSHEFPARPAGLAVDYRVFYAASELMARGGNPYHLGALQAAEQAALAYPERSAAPNSFVDPPIAAWLLVPLSRLSYWVSYGVLTVVGILLVALTLTLLARDLGWRHTGVLVGAAMVSWIGLLGLLDGQFDAILFAALAGSMLLAWHERSLAAGLVLGVTLIKPTLLWPVPIFILLALWPDRRRVLEFAGGYLLVAVLFLLASWSLLASWWHALALFARGIGTVQPDLAGLPGLLAAAPASWRLSPGLTAPATLATVCVGLACMAVFGVWMMISPDWRRVSPVGRVTWAVALPVGIWLLATPYAHPNDDLLLLPLFMLTVGRDARRVHGLGLGLSLATLVLILLIWPSGVIPWQLGLALLGLLSAALWHWRTEVRLTGFGAGLCVLVLATLPAVWGFHLLAVGLTPIAVLILVVEGGRTCWIEVGGAGTGPAYFEEPTVPGIAPLASGA